MTTGRRTMRASAPQSVTFVELFFDLVFVFAVTQVTVLTAHDLTPAGIVRSVLIFWLIWWGWTQFTWTLNPADTTHAAVRLITLVATRSSSSRRPDPSEPSATPEAIPPQRPFPDGQRTGAIRRPGTT